MNNPTNPSGTTRRSFIKRSVVAAVAVSSMSIFSGLVNAEDVFGYNTTVVVNCVRDNHENGRPAKPDVGEPGSCPDRTTCTWSQYRVVLREGRKMRIKEGWIPD